MKQSDFYKVGADKRQDQVIKIGVNNYLLIFGYCIDEDGNGYNMRHIFDHKPTAEEIRQTILAVIDATAQSEIESGMTYNGAVVWLSAENQRNYLSAALRVQNNIDGALPVTVKLGTDESPVFVQFDTGADYLAFFKAYTDHINEVLTKAWEEKKAINMDDYKIE